MCLDIMPRSKRKLIQLGNKSLVVTIPWEIVDALDLRKGERVFVTLDEKTHNIIVENGEKSQD